VSGAEEFEELRPLLFVHVAADGATNEVTSAVACHQGRRVVDLAAALEAGRAA
jgi:hypothetical protein